MTTLPDSGNAEFFAAIVRSAATPASSASHQRTLTSAQQQAVERIKTAEMAFLGTLVAVLGDEALIKEGNSVDGRWMAIARTHVEEGTMAAVRAVTKPESAEFPAPRR